MGSGPRILAVRLRRLAPFDACASYPEIRLAEMRWVLTEAADPDQEEGSWLEMLTTAEQQELRQIERGAAGARARVCPAADAGPGPTALGRAGPAALPARPGHRCGGAAGIPDRGVAVVRGGRQVVA